MFVHFCKSAPALTAGHKAGKQGFGLAAVLARSVDVFDLHHPLACPHSFPEVLVNDPQVWDICNDQVLFWIEGRYAFAFVWGFGVVEAVPYLAADIEFICESAGAAFTVAVNGGGAPIAPCGASDAFSDILGRQAFGIVFEYPFNDVGFC